MLLSQGASLIQANHHGHPCLHVALLQASDVLNLLLTLGFDVKQAITARNSLGSTPLHTAVVLRNLPAVELLLKYGAPVDVEDGQGATPYMRARSPSPNELRYLEEAGLGGGWLPVVLMGANGDENAIGEALLKAGATRRGLSVDSDDENSSCQSLDFALSPAPLPSLHASLHGSSPNSSYRDGDSQDTPLSRMSDYEEVTPLQTQQPSPKSYGEAAMYMSGVLRDLDSSLGVGRSIRVDPKTLFHDPDFSSKLQTMREMGLEDAKINAAALLAGDKNLETAVLAVVENRVHRTEGGTIPAVITRVSHSQHLNAMALLSDPDFSSKLQTMGEMGFEDTKINMVALVAADKNFDMAVIYVAENRVHKTVDGMFSVTQPSQLPRTVSSLSIS